MNELNVMTLKTTLEIKLDIDEIADYLADRIYETIIAYGGDDFDHRELELIEMNENKILLAVAKTWIKNLE